MADTRNISQPTQGSENVGMETNSSRTTDAPSAGSDTQTKIAAGGHGKKEGDKKNVNDDELVVNNEPGNPTFENTGKKNN